MSFRLVPDGFAWRAPIPFFLRAAAQSRAPGEPPQYFGPCLITPDGKTTPQSSQVYSIPRRESRIEGEDVDWDTGCAGLVGRVVGVGGEAGGRTGVFGRSLGVSDDAETEVG